MIQDEERGGVDAWDRFSSDSSGGGGSGVIAVAHESGRTCLNEQREKKGDKGLQRGVCRRERGQAGSEERDIMGARTSERVYAMRE